MRHSEQHARKGGRRAAWVKLVAGGLLITGAVLLLMQGHAPPGLAGEVVRNNLRRGIDATPLFYTGVESAAESD